MSNRLIPQTGEYFHVYNRGVEKRDIFTRSSDYERFLTTIFHYRQESPQKKLSYLLRHDPDSLNAYHAPFIVSLIGYSLMPNHFHLLIKQTADNGLSRFANRIQDSYTKYFNTRHDRVGHLLQGPYQFIRVETNDHLLHVLRYVHLNAPVAELSVDAFDYPWSSARHYLDRQSILPLDTSLVLKLLPRSKFAAFHSDYQGYARSLNTIKHLVLD